MTTVGVSIALEHTAASPVGAEVVADAELIEVEGRRLTFRVRVAEGDKEVGSVRVRRAVVDRARFLSRL